MPEALSEQAIENALFDLPGWQYEGGALTKTYQLSTFMEAISFIVRLAFYAEEMKHHPELRNVYNTVEVTLRTHDAGNAVTQKDVDLAQAIERFSWV